MPPVDKGQKLISLCNTISVQNNAISIKVLRSFMCKFLLFYMNNSIPQASFYYS